MQNNMSGSRNRAPSKIRRRITTALVIIVLFLAVAYLGIGAYAASQVTAIDEHEQYTDTPATFGLEYQDVVFSARGDDQQLSAWYIPNHQSSRAVIMVHGRDASKQNAISGKIVELGAAIHDAGFSVLMIDLRGHGGSEGTNYSFGIFERRDVLGGVDFLLEKGIQPGSIGVFGLSMGTCAAVGAAAEEPAIGVMVLSSSLADLNPLIEEQWENESGMPKFVLPAVFIMNRLLFGYDLRDVQPVKEIVSFTPKPVMIIHCTSDELIPMWHPQTFLDAYPSAESYYFDDCDHAEIYRDYPQEYKELVVPFFERNVK